VLTTKPPVLAMDWKCDGDRRLVYHIAVPAYRVCLDALLRDISLHLTASFDPSTLPRGSKWQYCRMIPVEAFYSTNEEPREQHCGRKPGSTSYVIRECYDCSLVHAGRGR
jgi:hypothetical protein